MQPTLSRLILALIVALSAPGLALAQAAAAGAKVATVNGVVISKAKIDAVVRSQEARGQKDTPELRAAIRNSLITWEVVAQEANHKGLAKNADTLLQLELARTQILFQAFSADFFNRQKVSDDELKAEFGKLKTKMSDKEYKARHILLGKEADAKEIIEKLKKGEKFEELAKASTDPGSKDKGGELEWAQPGGFVKPFSDAMVKLEKGKYTETPVETPYGWHVIRLEDVRPAKIPDFDEVKPGLQQRMLEAKFEKAVADLRAKAKVE
jgi:peptidyl-prolyl cis-trans isomerase C